MLGGLRCAKCHAVFWVTPRSAASCTERPAFGFATIKKIASSPRLSAQLRGVHEGVAHHRENACDTRGTGTASDAATPPPTPGHPHSADRPDRSASGRDTNHTSAARTSGTGEELREPHPGADDLMGFTHVPMIPTGV